MTAWSALASLGIAAIVIAVVLGGLIVAAVAVEARLQRGEPDRRPPDDQ